MTCSDETSSALRGISCHGGYVINLNEYILDGAFTLEVHTNSLKLIYEIKKKQAIGQNIYRFELKVEFLFVVIVHLVHTKFKRFLGYMGYMRYGTI